MNVYNIDPRSYLQSPSYEQPMKVFSKSQCDQIDDDNRQGEQQFQQQKQFGLKLKWN